MSAESDRHPDPPAMGYLWMRDEFEKINRKLDIILDQTPRLCTPELTKQVKRAVILSFKAEKTLPNIK